MASVSTTAQLLGPTVTVFLTATATPTPTASAAPPPPPVYAETFEAYASFQDIVVFGTGVLVAFILGDFNRFVAVPIVTPLLGVLANILDWYGWSWPGWSNSHRKGTVVISEIFYTFQWLIGPLYSLFLLEKILSGMTRRLYLAVYFIIYLTTWVLQIFMWYLMSRWFDPGTTEENGLLLDKLDKTCHALVATMELWSAYFLVRSFYLALQNSKSLGMAGSRSRRLFTQFMRSSEIRVASQCIGAILRLTTYRSINKDMTPVERGIANFAFVLNESYPIVLQLDLVATKLAKLQHVAVAAMAPIEHRAGEKGDQAHVVAKQVDASETGLSSTAFSGNGGTLDSINRDFGQYASGADTWNSSMARGRP